MPRPREHSCSKVQTLTYNYKGMWTEEPPEEEDEEQTPPKKPMVTDRKVIVDVYLHKKIDDSKCKQPPYPVKQVWFELKCESVKDKDQRALSFVGEDIELLRTTMWGALDARFEVQWFDYYLVNLNVKRPYEGPGTEVNFHYKDVRKGIAHDGTMLMREWCHNEYRIKPWPGEFTDHAGKAMACIPATPENKKSLESFSERFTEVGERMKDMLRPKNIMKTLGSLSTAMPLLAPEDTTKTVGIEVELEPPDMLREPAERCFRCHNPTHYWFMAKDVACCLACAANVTLADVPTKEEWIGIMRRKYPTN